MEDKQTVFPACPKPFVSIKRRLTSEVLRLVKPLLFDPDSLEKGCDHICYALQNLRTSEELSPLEFEQACQSVMTKIELEDPSAASLTTIYRQRCYRETGYVENSAYVVLVRSIPYTNFRNEWLDKLIEELEEAGD